MSKSSNQKRAAKAITHSGKTNSHQSQKKKRFRLGLGFDTPWVSGEAGYDLMDGIYFDNRETAPVSAGPVPRVAPGMADINNLRLSYDCGALTFGNGTVGVDNAGYLKSLDGTQQWYSTPVPIAPADTTANTAVGAAYIQDIVKHFARMRYKSVRVDYLPEFSNATENVTLYIAPVRGGQSAYSSAAPGAGSPTPILPATVQSMKGARGGPHWTLRGIGIDLTPYIAGGTGKNQNEFTVFNNDLNNVADADNQISVPCGFVVGGFTNSALVKNTIVGRFRVSIVVDLLDYIGALSLGTLQARARKDRVNGLVKAVIDELKVTSSDEDVTMISSDGKEVKTSEPVSSSSSVVPSQTTYFRPPSPKIKIIRDNVPPIGAHIENVSKLRSMFGS